MGKACGGIREYLLSYDALGNVVSYTDGNGNVTEYTRSPSGNVEKMTGPDGKTDRSATYDIWGRQQGMTDGNGGTTLYTRDRAGRVTTVTKPDGSREHYGYDYAGNITKGTDGNGNTTEFLYNGGSNLEMIKKADGTERLFDYDSEERCTCRRDEDGNTIRMGYNLDGSMVLASGTPKGLGAPSISSIYRYDERGFLTSAMEGNTAYHYKRDSEGRVTEKSDSRRKLFSVRYNPDRTIDMLGGTRYYYNYAGQMTCVMPDCGPGANYEYDNNGALIKTECDNGLTTTYSYDSRGRLESLKAGFEGETALLDAKYTYDGNGNRTGKEEKFFMEKGSVPASAVTQYAYDSMNRLTMESRNGFMTAYTYDMAGNRTSRVKGDDREEYRYNSRNQLTELSGAGTRTSYQYDPSGNLTQEQRYIQERVETRKYAYDAYNRNIEVKGGYFHHKNFYDAEGLRNRTEENGKATDFVYSGDMLYSEQEENSTRERRYILGNEFLGHRDSGHGAADPNEDSKQAYSYITDEQGSLRYILNAGRQVETYQEYSAFGERITSEGAFSRLGYNSQMEDELTGLTYLRARYYNPATGRFTQEDVIYDDGFNLYVYCGSNPVIYCDPSGFAKNPLKPVNQMSYDEIKEELNDLYREFVKNKNSNIPSVSNTLIKDELKYGRYGSLPKPSYDDLTGHHMPSNDFMLKNTGTPGRKSWAMNLEQPNTAGRHRRTFTYGLGSDSRGKQLYDALTPRDALAFDMNDLKRILKEDGVYDEYARKQLRNYIKEYTSNEEFKEFFDKNSKYNAKSKCSKK